jgi:hypothetical protein
LPWGCPINHHISQADFLRQRHLTLNSSDRFSAGKPVPLLEPSNLGFAVGGNHDYFVDTFVYAGFEEEGDIIDYDGIGIIARNLFCQPGLFA